MFRRKKQREIEGGKYLTTVEGQMQLDIVQSLLDSYDIPIYIIDEVTGSFIRILMGSSYFNTDIYVKEEDYETAHAALFGKQQDDE